MKDKALEDLFKLSITNNNSQLQNITNNSSPLATSKKKKLINIIQNKLSHKKTSNSNTSFPQPRTEMHYCNKNHGAQKHLESYLKKLKKNIRSTPSSIRKGHSTSYSIIKSQRFNKYHYFRTTAAAILQK